MKRHMQAAQLPSWATAAISSACETEEWDRIVDCVMEKISLKLHRTGCHLSDLSIAEQCALIEREFHMVRVV